MKTPLIFLTLSALVLSACSSSKGSWSPISWSIESSDASGRFKVGNSYKVGGKRYTPKETYNFSQTGVASWYGPKFHGKLTANGEIYNQNALTAAHKTLQMPSIVRVTNLENGRSIIVRVNDRGPFSRGRIIDMSKRGAELLQFKGQGTAKVKVQILPEESRFVAQAARDGRDISGIEVALNEGKSLQEFLGVSPAPEAVETELLEVASLNAQDQIHPNKAPLDPQNFENRLGAQDAGQVVGEVKRGPTSQEKSETLPLKPAKGITAQPLAPMPDLTKNKPAQPQRTVSDVVNDLVPVEVQTAPVMPTNIYIQAGSFGQQANAHAYAQKLSLYGEANVSAVEIASRDFYRVRIGPIENVDKADAILEKMSAAGENKAIIIVGE